MKINDVIDKILGKQDEKNFLDIMNNFPEKLPVLLFDEYRFVVMQDSNLSVSKGIKPYLIIRSRADLKSKNNVDRGYILEQFSLIEFVLTLFILLGEGVYINPQLYTEVKEYWLDYDNASAAKLIKYAKYKNLISKSTKQKLWLAKDIRNLAAHKYLPELSLSELISSYRHVKIEKYEQIIDGIDEIMSNAWASILGDYSKSQWLVAEYVNKELKEP